MRLRCWSFVCVALLAIPSSVSAEVLQVIVVGGQESELTKRVIEKLELQFTQVTDLQLILPAPMKPTEKPAAKVADLVLQLEVLGAKADVVGCTIQEPSGVLLFDCTLDEGSANAIAGQLAEFVKIARDKRSADWKGKRIQVLGASAEWASSAQAAMLDTLANVVAYQLVSSPDVIVLPNPKRAGAKEKENDAPRAADAATMSLLLKFTGDTPETLKETVVLLDSKRQTVAEFSLKIEQFDADLLRKTAETTLQKLELKPGRKPAAKERAAHRYRQLAEYAWSHQHVVESLGWSETALMFNPNDGVSRRKLIDRLVRESAGVSRPHLVQRRPQQVPWTAAEAHLLAVRALELQVADAQSLKADDVLGLQGYFKFPELLERLPLLNEQIKLGDPPMDAKKRRELIGTQCVVRPLGLYLAYARKNREAAYQYSLAVSQQVGALLRIADEQDPESSQMVLGVLSAWLDFFDELTDGQKPWAAVNPVLREVTAGNSRVLRGEHYDRFLDRVRQHPHPLLKLLAQRRDITRGWTYNEPAPEVRAEKLRPYRKAAIELLETSVKGNQRSLVSAIIQALSETYHGGFHGPGVLAERISLGEDMLRVGAVSPRVIFDGIEKVESELAPRAHKVTADFIAFAKAKPSAVHESPAASAIQQAREILVQLERDHSNVPTSTPKRYFETLTLGTDLILEPEELKRSHLVPIGIRNDRFVCWLIAGPNSLAQLLSISLKHGQVQMLGALEGRNPREDPARPNAPIFPSCLHDKDCYFAWPGGGIGRVSLELDPATQLSISDRLPKGVIHSIASLGEHIYVGLDSGYLLRFKPLDNEFETLASSSREPAETPLDHTVSFRVTNLVADPPRKRVLFVTRRTEENRRLAELWEFNAETSKIRHLAKLGHQQLHRNYMAIQGDSLVLGDVWIVAWNLKTEKSEVWSNYNVGDLPVNHRLWLPQCQTPVFCKGSIWWVNPNGLLGELTPATTATDNHLLPASNAKPLESQYGNYLFPVDDKRFLMYHGGTLTLVTPGERTAK